MYKVQWEKQAKKDFKNIESANLTSKVSEILITVRKNPYEESQNFERLKYDLQGMCSRKINKKHRFVYEVSPNTENLIDPNGVPYEGIVKVASMWSHYGDK
jgi:Txe/YoeB family toxin of toxin-antitoxin system